MMIYKITPSFTATGLEPINQISIKIPNDRYLVKL